MPKRTKLSQNVSQSVNVNIRLAEALSKLTKKKRRKRRKPRERKPQTYEMIGDGSGGQVLPSNVQYTDKGIPSARQSSMVYYSYLQPQLTGVAGQMKSIEYKPPIPQPIEDQQTRRINQQLLTLYEGARQLLDKDKVRSDTLESLQWDMQRFGGTLSGIGSTVEKLAGTQEAGGAEESIFEPAQPAEDVEPAEEPKPAKGKEKVTEPEVEAKLAKEYTIFIRENKMKKGTEYILEVIVSGKHRVIKTYYSKSLAKTVESELVAWMAEKDITPQTVSARKIVPLLKEHVKGQEQE